ncbi:hypothetical protein S245_040910, partial [Arachis hypogaea]
EGHEWYNALLLLPRLEELSMSDCGLMGTFPPEIFHITTLSYIDISVNQDLHGSFLDFPLNGSLHTIIVGHTKFSGTLPLSMGNMVNLSILYLYNCNFSGTLPISFSKLTELKEMDLSNNNFVGPISSSALFEGMQSLSSIDLSYNSISGTIPSSLFMIPSLQYVDLSNNQFSKLEEFTDVFTSKLEYLDLSCNNLSGSIPPPIFQLRGLASLNLSNNKLSGPIPPSIIQHSGLNELDLSSNKFSGAMQIDALVQLKNLNDLDLSFNKIDDVNFTDVALSTFPQLRSLNLASCNLKTFPGFLRYQSGLNELDLSYNQIQGTVPNWIWRLYNIGHYMSNTLYLSLANNSFHGSIPHSLCSASKLQVLDLSHNKISGKVTHCLMNLGETLGVLNLGNNELTGHIPDTFPSSCALHTVVLNENRLAGPLPKSLAHCTALEVLDVGRNQIVGAFPCFLSHISKLLVLVLRNNKFHGPMGCPKDNGVWNIIQIVDAAFNNFSGELPVKWFRGWKKMISNDDGANSELSNIQFGRDNSDPIYYQDSVTVISKGQEMELVKILTIFTSIDFSYNQFEGPIPIELMKFKALYLLNLSHNAFSGQIPSSIGNLNQLESLDLSMNSLKGEIPRACQFELPIISEPLLQSSDSSFEENDGLYGPRLTKSPSHGMHALPPPEMPQCGSLACEVHWNLVSAEMGLVFGLGIIFGPLLFWKKWRVHYCQFLDKILCRIFPQLTHNFERRGGQNYKVL